MFVELVGNQLLASIGELVEWESVVCHLIALIILTVGLYLLLFKPVKRMIKERQDKIKKIEKENSDLNAEVKKMKESTAVVLSEAKKEAAVIHENAVKAANQKADDIVTDAKNQARNLIERTEKSWTKSAADCSLRSSVRSRTFRWQLPKKFLKGIFLRKTIKK